MRTSVVFLICLCVATTVYGDCPRPTGGSNTVLIPGVSFPAREGTEVTFDCKVGYQKVGGSGTVVCSGGNWTTLNIRCEIKNCDSAGEVTNGYIDYSEGTTFGAFARVVCNEGYRAVGADKQVLCGINGWEGRLAECEVIMCDQPSPIANGYFDPKKDDYEHSEVITYSCEGEHKLNGSRTASCQEDGKFKPAPPKCVLVACSEPKVEDGVVASGSRPPYKHLSSVTFRCNVGHTMKGQDTVSCDINSKWSPALPECEPIKCEVPVVPNGEVVGGSRPTYKFGETITVKCSDEYRLSGQSTLTCGERSQWSPALPQCTQKNGGHTKEIVGGILGVSLAVQWLLLNLW